MPKRAPRMSGMVMPLCVRPNSYIFGATNSREIIQPAHRATQNQS